MQNYQRNAYSKEINSELTIKIRASNTFQSRIQNPVKHQNWNILRKQFTSESRSLFFTKSSSYKFDLVVTTPLYLLNSDPSWSNWLFPKADKPAGVTAKPCGEEASKLNWLFAFLSDDAGITFALGSCFRRLGFTEPADFAALLACSKEGVVLFNILDLVFVEGSNSFDPTFRMYEIWKTEINLSNWRGKKC